MGKRHSTSVYMVGRPKLTTNDINENALASLTRRFQLGNRKKNSDNTQLKNQKSCQDSKVVL